MLKSIFGPLNCKGRCLITVSWYCYLEKQGWLGFIPYSLNPDSTPASFVNYGPGFGFRFWWPIFVKLLKSYFYKSNCNTFLRYRISKLHEGGHYCLLGSGSGDSIESGSGSDKPG